MDMYQIDAFASKVFEGNPAAVLHCEEWLSDRKMQDIAMENNLSETAFVVKEKSGYRIRWFTPTKEVRLCGHATLAAAHMFYEHLGYQEQAISFASQSGTLRVDRTDEGYKLDFPTDTYEPAPAMKDTFAQILGLEPLELVKGSDDYLARVGSQEELDGIVPDLAKLGRVEARGLLVTALGKEVDFVSRGFFPAYGIDEDPVTGSAHTLLTPYWAERTGKTTLQAEQRSARGGRLLCQLKGDRVTIAGQAITYAHAKLYL